MTTRREGLMGGELHELTAREAAAALREGRVGAVELLTALLGRTERLDATVGAYVTLMADRAVEAARAADRELAAARRTGAATPPLLGVPVPVKDLADVAGVPSSYGSAALAGTMPDADAGVVTLLRAAGAVLPGKTNVPELGLPCYTEPDVAPPARTPWDLRRSAGGSSGGAAAAVAAGLAPVAHGSDGGGSIRVPASVCGLVGLKPSRGRVSPGPRRADFSGLGADGVLSRDVRDTALLLDVLAHRWPGEPTTVPAPGDGFLAACERPPGRLRIGLLQEPVAATDADVHPVCTAAAESVAEVLAGLGHSVRAAPVPFGPERFAAFRDVWGVGAAIAPVPPEREHLLRPLTRWLRDSGARVSGVGLARALAGLHAASRDTAAAWEAFDVVLSPTLAAPPALVGGLRDDADPAADFAAQTRYTPWTSVSNVTGRPSVSLPLVRTVVDGVLLPVGVMLGAEHGAEELLLSLAAQLEQAMPWAGTLPVEPEVGAGAGAADCAP